VEDNKLATLLVDEQRVTAAQIAQAQAMAKATGGAVGTILVKLGFITDDVLAAYTSRVDGVERIDISGMILPESLISSIPRACIEKHRVIPIKKDHKTITLAMANPEDLESIEEIQFITGMKVHAVIASKESINRAITQFFDELDVRKEEDDAPAVGVAARTDELAMSATPTHEVALDSGAPALTEYQIQRALIPLLIEKGIITDAELQAKARQIEAK